MRTVNQNNKLVTFYQDGDLVGQIDYSDRSEPYVEDAIDNWLNGIMTIETVERHSVYYARKGEVSLNIELSNK